MEEGRRAKILPNACFFSTVLSRPYRSEILPSECAKKGILKWQILAITEQGFRAINVLTMTTNLDMMI